ncbi:MAG: phosphate acyltransferase [Collinsella sp.]
MVPTVAQPAPGSSVAGKASVLVFPDPRGRQHRLQLVQRFAGADAYGPILQGIAKPVNDLRAAALPTTSWVSGHHCRPGSDGRVANISFGTLQGKALKTSSDMMKLPATSCGGGFSCPCGIFSSFTL